jgi:hypothetical protein
VRRRAELYCSPPHRVTASLLMPAVSLLIGDVPVVISARSSRLVALFADYFRYYNPQLIAAEGAPEIMQAGQPALVIELKMCRHLPPRARLIPAQARLFSQTGVVSLWRATSSADGATRELFYFDLGVAAFRVDVTAGRAIGLVTPEALDYPHILANTYTLFALLLLLRTRGLYHLHAAALVSPRDELWLICGAQRAGKTTLTTALSLAGWRPISDDSLLVSAAGVEVRLQALKKYFHIGNELLHRWPLLAGVTRHHQYLDRTCIGGLEYFGARQLADASFNRVDHLVLPQIVNEPASRLVPLARSAALLKLAEQSLYFQLWPEHTAQQWRLLRELASPAACHSLLAGADILQDPASAMRALYEAESG